MTAPASAFRLYEAIAARMQAAVPTVRSWGFTSSAGREGASSAALGTALALASLQSERVLLIDANWSSPTLSRDAGATGMDLDACLRSKARLAEAIVATRAANLFLLPSTTTDTESPLDGLPKLMGDATAQFRYVLVDLPPILRAPALAMSWSAVLGQLIVMVDRGATRGRSLKRAMRVVAPIRQPALVFNG